MTKNPKLYQINTRVWLRRFDTESTKAKLSDVPDEYWDKIASLGFNYTWLMGIWKTNESTIKKYCFDDDLKYEYGLALKDWKEEDVIGSPFAIDSYEINPAICDDKTLLAIKRKLNMRGIGLILDFIPNHFSADTSLLKKKPGIFLETNMDYFYRDPHTFYKPDENEDRVFAHGRDPFFPAWQDTVQVNYFSAEARDFMIKTLFDLTKICDGVRCDMAMLSLNNVFKNTWGGVLSTMELKRPKDEFWKPAIEIIKGIRSDFLFIAEVYWDLEWEMQQLGFDYTYDKEMFDRLQAGNAQIVRDHLFAEYDFQNNSVRFIENHDEKRAITNFGKEKSKAAAVIISTIRGLRLYHDGQFEGKKIKLPVQLGREPIEAENKCIYDFYQKLMNITSDEIFLKGEWNLIDVLPAWDNNETSKNVIAWQWKLAHEKCLVIVNYSNVKSQCRVKLDVKGYPEEFRIKDLLNDENFIRSAEETLSTGLFVELKAFDSHILAY